MTHKNLSDYLSRAKEAKVISSQSSEAEGDRYNGFSCDNSTVVYEFPDGVKLSVNHWYEPGDMFTSSDRGGFASIIDDRGYSFDKLTCYLPY